MVGKPTTAASGGTGDARFLHELESLGRALSVDPKPQRRRPSTSAAVRPPDPNPNPKPKLNPPSKKDSKPSSSFWSSWKPTLKSLSNIRHRHFDCRFTLHVHSIQNLPAALAGAALTVHWKRTTDPAPAASTRPSRGTAAAVFDETLAYRCSVHGKGGGAGNTAKYEPRHFLIWASMAGAVDLGRHLVDLTRLLPLQLEEEEKRIGEWSTSFPLSGKAKGATLNVSFGFSCVGDGSSFDMSGGGGEKKAAEDSNLRPGRGRGGGVPRRGRSRSVEDWKGFQGSLRSSRSELPDVEQQKLSDKEVDTIGANLKPPELEDVRQHEGNENKDFDEQLEFMVIEQGIEIGSDKVELDGVDNGGELVIPSAKPDEPLGDFSFGDYSLRQGGELVIQSELSVKLDEPLGDLSFGDDSLRQGGELVIQSELSVNLDEPLGDLSFGDDDLGPNSEGPTLGELSFRNDGLRLNSEDQDLDSALGELSFRNDGLRLNSEDQDLDSALGDLSILDVESPIVKPRNRLNSEDLVSALGYLSILDVELPIVKPRNIDSSIPRQICKPGSMMSRSLSLDGSTDSVENEFLSMLGLNHSSEDSPLLLSSGSDPDSPRERLWKQFEKETSATGDGIFGLDQDPGWGVYLEDPDLSSIVDEAETELEKAAQYMDSKSRAKMLEDAETEALMRDWGLNEEAFRSSPPENMSGFGSPIYIPPEEPLELPPLGEGLGPFLQTKDGGFVRSMNPSLFKNAKNKGSLIMQVSSPVVVPVEMGSGVMEILQQLASVGIEKLSMQAKKLMPLEDISGMTMQQASWEAAPEEYPREAALDTDSGIGQNTFGGKKKAKRPNPSSPSSWEMSSEYVSLEELAPLAMDKIETLSIEGLRIQSGMSGEEAPSNINPDISAWKGEESNNIRSLGVDGAAGLQLMDVKDNGDDVDGLMGLSITLDEWMRLDSGIVDDDQISDRTSKILAAHHACSTDFVTAGKKGDKRGGKRSGKRWGLLGNNFTVVLMVQLRDPLRDYEPVGTPMLALVQVERVFVPPKPKIYSTVLERGNSEQEDESETKTEQSSMEEEKEGDDVVPQFKITEVHVAGLKTEPDKKKIWSNPIQQQSGSRWLLASGMGKNNKTLFMKSKCVKSSPVTAAVQPRDNLWSISSRIQGAVSKWKGLASPNPHIRNPNVILPS